MSRKARSERREKQASPKGGKRYYEAAKVDRLSADWIFSHQTADRDIELGLKTIRARARDLEQNNDWVRRYLSLVEANVIGGGFVLTLPGIEKPQAKKIIDGFNAWLEAGLIGMDLGKADAERLELRTVARDGECLIRLYRGDKYRDGLGYQILESDFLDETKTQDLRDGRRIVMGVELNAMNERIAYHMFTRHPGDSPSGVSTKTQSVPADDIIHIRRAERPGQTRAVSWLASSLKTLRMLYGYIEAELVASRISASKMGFYKIPPGEDFTADGSDGATGAPVSDASPGTFERMPTGWDFVPYDPQHPNSQAGTFLKTILRQLAGGLNVAYNNFANDLDGVSFSSIRSGTIEEREQWKVLQQWFARADRQKLFNAWVDSVAISGSYGVRASNADQIKSASKWTGRRWAWVDPQADITAKKEEIALGINTPSKIAAENGDDFGQLQAQLSQDNTERVNAGLNPIGGQSAAVQDTALNGAQIASAVQVITAAAQGQIPVESVAPLLKASFPSLDDDEIAAITKPLNNFKAKGQTNGQ